MMGAQWKHFFDASTAFSFNTGAPQSLNYSILDRREPFFDDDGCATWRLQVGNTGTWENLDQMSHFTVWEQCHDPFTESTDGTGYSFIAGEESTTCGVFNGLHARYQGHSYTCDPDTTDGVGCWWMQIVPHTDYNNSGYLEGYEGPNYHQWQVLWLR